MPSFYSGVKITREQAAQLLYNVGFRGDDLVKMVAIAGRESGYDVGAHRTDASRSSLSGDRGLWQINYIWDAELIQAGIIENRSDLFDAATNARAAWFVYKRQGLQAWNAGTGPTNGTDMTAARQAVNSAIQQNTIPQDALTTSSSTTGNANPTSTPTNAGSTLPTDTKLVRNDNGIYAVYTVADNVFLYYSVTEDEAQASGLSVEKISNADFKRRYPGAVGAGSVSEIVDVRANFGSYAKFWESILNQTISTTNAARYDKGVLKVLAEYAARPDMTEAELNNRLQATSWYQQRTSAELEWNGLSEAEKEARRQDTLVKMAQTWQQFTGEDIATTDKRLRSQLENVASGKTSLGVWTEQFVKPRAEQMSESPWSRQLRTEVEEQRRRPVDIENTANQIRQTLDRWGLEWGERSIHTWAVQLVEKTRSDDDLLKTIRGQAKVLYPWKDESMETITAAAPWIETYERVMERTGGLRTPEVKAALRQNTAPWEMEQQLKQTSAWLGTKNGQEEMYSAAMAIGQTMGFE